MKLDQKVARAPEINPLNISNDEKQKENRAAGQFFSSLLETQSAALLQLLKDKGIANEEELAAHFEQAGKASSVRWLAVRVRIDYLLSSAMKTAEQDVKKESPKTTENPIAETSRERETHEDTLDIPKTAASSKPVVDDTGAGTKNDQNQQGEEDSQASKKAAENAA
jgi:hypothetical protein